MIYGVTFWMLLIHFRRLHLALRTNCETCNIWCNDNDRIGSRPPNSLVAASLLRLQSSVMKEEIKMTYKILGNVVALDACWHPGSGDWTFQASIHHTNLALRYSEIPSPLPWSALVSALSSPERTDDHKPEIFWEWEEAVLAMQPFHMFHSRFMMSFRKLFVVWDLSIFRP